MPRPRTVSLMSLALGLLIATHPSGADPTKHSPRLAGSRVLSCGTDLQHPLQVTVRALDPITRGANVRIEVAVTPRRPLGRGEVQLVSTGGANARGRARVEIASLVPDRIARAEFTVNVPMQGPRFLLEFAVRGEGVGARYTRGATFNLLPDGPLNPGRRVTTTNGETVLEYSARRIGS